MTKSGTLCLLRVNDQNSVTIQHANETRSGHNFVAIDENVGTNLQAQAFLHRLSEITNSNYIL